MRGSPQDLFAISRQRPLRSGGYFCIVRGVSIPIRPRRRGVGAGGRRRLQIRCGRCRSAMPIAMRSEFRRVALFRRRSDDSMPHGGFGCPPGYVFSARQILGRPLWRRAARKSRDATRSAPRSARRGPSLPSDLPAATCAENSPRMAAPLLLRWKPDAEDGLSPLMRKAVAVIKTASGEISRLRFLRHAP